VESQQAQIIWGEKSVPVSARFEDPYFSLADGLAETRHVFLQGNALAERLKQPLRIAELGFGTGLNVLATLALRAELRASAPLRITSFEAFPLSAAEMARALAPFAELAPLAGSLLDGIAAGKRQIELVPGAILLLEIGDARERLPLWSAQADAWFLDGFSPAKNPELWSPELMQAVGAHTAAEGTFATYTAAGFVRRGLEAAGFDVTRVPGFGAKRHMTRGVLR
jgi:tRNA U34 5-methylaminomethyl-2-thiouridine-forming methyltransferase MnmC